MARMSEAALANERWAMSQETLTDDETRALLRSAHEGGLTDEERDAVFERVYNANARLVFIILRTKYFILTETDWDDFEQESKTSLYRAVKLYDYGRRDCKFVTYAARAINNAIRETCRTNRVIPIPDKTSRKIAKIKRAEADFERSCGRKPTDEEVAEILEYDTDLVKRCRELGRQSCLLIGDGMATEDGDGDSDGAEWMTAVSLGDGVDGRYAMTEDSVDSEIFFSNLLWLGKDILSDKDIAIIRLVLSAPCGMSQGAIANVFQVTRESISHRVRQVRLVVAAAMYVTWGRRAWEGITVSEVQDFILERVNNP